MQTTSSSYSAPRWRDLLMLAWPIIVTRSTQVVIGLADALMTAHLGHAALAATTTGGLDTYIVLILPMGTVFIVGSYASQYMGRGDKAGARRYGFYGLAVAVLAQLLALVGMPLVAPLLALTSFEPDVQSLMSIVITTRLFTGGAAIGMEALGSYYGGLGNTRLPMFASLIAMATNVLGNWVLIDGHLGAPALGVLGAALASALSTLLAFLVLLFIFLREGYLQGRIVPPALAPREFWRMLRFGLPSGLNWFFEFLAFNMFINVVMAHLGTTAVAAMMSVLQLNSVSFMPAFGLASAGAILVGQAIGAGNKDDVPRIARLAVRTTASWQGFVSLAYIGMPVMLLSFFAEGQGREAFMSVGVRILTLSAFWQVFDGVVNTYAESLRAAGDTSFTMWARAGLAWALLVPGAYVTVNVLGFGDVAAMLWLVGYMGVLAGLVYWRFASGRWRHMQLIEPSLLE